jgi:hypothetical protein
LNTRIGVLRGHRFLTSLAAFASIGLLVLPCLMDGETGSALDTGPIFVQIPGDDPGALYSSVPLLPPAAPLLALLVLGLRGRMRG